MLGAGFRLSGFPRRAVLAYRESVSLDPSNAWAWTSLGNALRDIRHLQSAIRCHRRAVAIAPSVPALTANLGLALAAANRHEEAIACFDEVLSNKPGDANARWDRGLSLLRLGRLAEGWEDYEARFDTGKLPKRELPGERWHGQPYPGEHLLLLSEQGIGDALWTARYLPRVKALGGKLILETRPELVSLMQHMGVADAVVPKGGPLPSADWHLHICSLPGLFTRSLADVEGSAYLSAPATRGQHAVAAIKSVKDRLRVGIVWSGSTTFEANHERRSSLDAFLTAFVMPKVQLYSLQKGPPAFELKRYPNAPVIDLAPMLVDFCDTAAAVAALDLIIMTDSAVAHLAGAIGTRVWVLANFGSYWLWHDKPTESPWYQSLRLFRATAWNGFDRVFDNAAHDLAQMTESHS